MKDFIISDHRPIMFTLDALSVPRLLSKMKAKESFFINWDTITTEQINVLSNCIFQAPTSVLNLKEYNENIYKNDIDVYFKQIISCLIKCSEDIVTKTNCNKRNFKPIPVWNDYVAEYHVKCT